VKATGGVFDPAQRPLYFLAGQWSAGSFPPDPDRPANMLVAINDLATPKAEAANLAVHLDAGRRVLLDSGVFDLAWSYAREQNITLADALSVKPEDMTGWADLYARYTSVVSRYGDRLWGWVELDQGGRDNKIRTRTGLEAAGQVPIPVYHPLNDGWDYFDQLAQSYDRICVANVVHAPRPVRSRILHTIWERHRAYPDLWVHVLGLSPSELAWAAPFDSCDASTWLASVRWGTHPQSAMLRPTPGLGPRFSYMPGTDDPARDRLAAVGVCLDTATAEDQLWTRAHADRAGFGPAYPPYLEQETPPCPMTP
jgi:hypothetical protein